jgi:hypothetical protein
MGNGPAGISTIPEYLPEPSLILVLSGAGAVTVAFGLRFDFRSGGKGTDGPSGQPGRSGQVDRFIGLTGTVSAEAGLDGAFLIADRDFCARAVLYGQGHARNTASRITGK